MRNFLSAYHTDAGIKKKINQDSLLLKGLEKDGEEILLAVICDGMGGMAKGELASATVVQAFSEWFETVYVQKGNAWTREDIKKQWQELLQQVNSALIAHGKEEDIQLGTTVSVLFLSSTGEYLIGHVGDTRVYELNDRLTQLTEDHTFIAREVKRGNMTPEQAATDSKRNVLLQCIGVKDLFEPQYCSGRLEKGNGMLLCSDGFRHKVTEQELYEKLHDTGAGRDMSKEVDMKKSLISLVELNKRRLEKDNITAILVKLV